MSNIERLVGRVDMAETLESDLDQFPSHLNQLKEISEEARNELVELRKIYNEGEELLAKNPEMQDNWRKVHLKSMEDAYSKGEEVHDELETQTLIQKDIQAHRLDCEATISPLTDTLLRIMGEQVQRKIDSLILARFNRQSNVNDSASEDAQHAINSIMRDQLKLSSGDISPILKKFPGVIDWKGEWSSSSSMVGATCLSKLNTNLPGALFKRGNDLLYASRENIDKYLILSPAASSKDNEHTKVTSMNDQWNHDHPRAVSPTKVTR